MSFKDMIQFFGTYIVVLIASALVDLLWGESLTDKSVILAAAIATTSTIISAIRAQPLPSPPTSEGDGA